MHVTTKYFHQSPRISHDQTGKILIWVDANKQGVSVRPFLALSRAQRTSDFYPERTPHARVWFIVFFAAHRTHTYNFCKSHDGYQFKSKLVLELPNGIRFLI